MSNVRKLGSFEKIFWLIDQTNQVHFVMAAEISGTFTSQQLRAALDLLQQRHPLFSVYIEADNYKEPYFKQVNNAPIPIRVASGNSLTNLNKELERELAQPFDWGQAPLIRSVLLQDDNKAVIILTSHHAIGDAIAMSFAFRDLLSILAGKQLDKLPVPESIDKRAGIIPQELAQGENAQSENVSLFTRREETKPHVDLLKLSTSLSLSVLDRARKEGTTVHGAICAAIIRAARNASDVWKAKQIRVVSPFSNRKILNGEEGYSLYIGSKKIIYEPENTPGFWDLARYTKNTIADVAPLESVITGTKGMRQLAFGDMDIQLLAQKLQEGIAREMMISNIGRLSFETDFGALKLESLWGPLAFSGSKGEQVIGVSNVNDSICLSHLSRMPINSLLHLAEAELEDACNLVS